MNDEGKNHLDPERPAKSYHLQQVLIDNEFTYDVENYIWTGSRRNLFFKWIMKARKH